MKVINITKKTSHKTEQLEKVIEVLCILNEIKLSKTEMRILAYFVVHGINKRTDALLVNAGVTEEGNLANTKTKLMKLGFLKKTPGLYKTYELNLNQNFENSNVIKLHINFDNT